MFGVFQWTTPAKIRAFKQSVGSIAEEFRLVYFEEVIRGKLDLRYGAISIKGFAKAFHRGIPSSQVPPVQQGIKMSRPSKPKPTTPKERQT